MRQARTTFEQRLLDIFTENDDLRYEFFHSQFHSNDSRYFTDENNLFAGISFKHEDNYGGEGQGEDYWSVYKFTDNETQEVTYLKFDGWYQSYTDADFNEMGFVTPKQQTVTVYE